MYFEIGTKTPDEQLGFIIAKHPDSLYERNMKKRSIIRGQYNTDKSRFCASIETDPLGFLHTARELNLTNYVHIQLSAVCPYNLTGFNEVFRSCLYKTFKGIPDEDALKKRDMVAFIGPFPSYEDTTIKTFEAFGMNPVVVRTDTEQAFMLELSGNMSASEFVQKVYFLSYQLTSRYDMVLQDVAKIVKFVRLCSDWLEQCEDEKLLTNIIKSLCKYHKGFIEVFKTHLTKTLTTKENAEPTTGTLEAQLNTKYVSLHERKHRIIVDEIENARHESDGDRTIWVQPINSIIDYGCGEGNLLKKLAKAYPEATIIGIDGSEKRIDHSKKKVPKRTKLLNQNLLCPNIDQDQHMPSVLINCEVIEHLETHERRKMLRIIRDVIRPATLIITTPNIEFNKNYDMEEGQLRHQGHKIEYTPAQFKEEVMDFLGEKYKVKHINIITDEEEWDALTVKTQPSFVLVCTIDKHIPLDKGLYTQIQKMYIPYYLDISGYELRARDFENGYASKPYMRNSKNLFYMAPTIPPVDYNQEYPDFLEHPQTAFDYYKERGIHEVVAERKYMGSRAYILIFKHREHAEKMGFNSPIIVNSRGGYPYFNGDDADELLQTLYEDIQPKMVDEDFLILDCEGMPWCFKGQRLIDQHFRKPGECALLTRSYGKQAGLQNAEKFMDVLNIFAKDAPMEFRMFQILAKGSIKEYRGKISFDKWVFGFTLNHQEKHKMLKIYQGDIFKPAQHIYVDFWNQRRDMCNDAIAKWEEYCADGGEGFVIKPIEFFNYRENGYLTQPMLKVRGQDYLRIIYGIDYLEKDYFNKVCHRRIRKKRIVAIQEFELSVKILRSFLQGNTEITRRLAAGFIGMENFVGKNMDATL